ncbi:hypothetical protein P8452_43229 [Trifolium repens]|nr:hypothetical protein P8452_43229 [Trifolium repens]
MLGTLTLHVAVNPSLQSLNSKIRKSFSPIVIILFNFFTSNRRCFKLVTSSGVVYIAIMLLCCGDLCHKWTEDTVVIV